ncbi:MAG: GTPase domain-containing protein, partial [Desulfobacterales bacterium]|nr:GTPase domain-containing protein [Desulfobacterales bacterium]
LEERKEKNIESIKNLAENLIIQNTSIKNIPLVLQYNKRDLSNPDLSLLPFDTLENDLNSQLRVPSFMASAINGENVIETLKKITSITMARLVDNLT